MSKKEMDKIVGAAFEELNADDMQQTQGAGDVDAETAAITPAISPICSPSVVANPTLVLSLVRK